MSNPSDKSPANRSRHQPSDGALCAQSSFSGAFAFLGGPVLPGLCTERRRRPDKIIHLTSPARPEAREC